jgi:hypothetical protein
MIQIFSTNHVFQKSFVFYFATDIQINGLLIPGLVNKLVDYFMAIQGQRCEPTNFTCSDSRLQEYLSKIVTTFKEVTADWLASLNMGREPISSLFMFLSIHTLHLPLSLALL